MNLIKLVCTMKDHIDRNNKDNYVISFDLSKAFDRTNHQILINQLEAAASISQ